MTIIEHTRSDSANFWRNWDDAVRAAVPHWRIGGGWSRPAYLFTFGGAK